MSAAFISAIKKNQTDTIHVFDHFHVQKLAGEALDKVRRDVYNQEKDLEKRKVIKGTRWLLLRRDKDIFSEDKKQRLDNIIKMNESLSKAYILNEYLQEVWKQNSYKEGEAVLDDWIRQARESNVPTLVKLGNSIAAYRTGILAYYKCRTSNAKVEGINNKIKGLTICPYKSDFNMIELTFRYIKNIIYKNVYNNLNDLKKDVVTILGTKNLKESLNLLYGETLKNYMIFIRNNININLNNIIHN